MATEPTKPVAAITGGARRVGGVISLALARAGYDLAVNFHESAPLAEQVRIEAEKLGAKTVCVAGDMASRPAVEAFFSATLETFGRVDLLVTNAGWFERTPIETLDELQWERMQRRNVWTTWLPAQRFGLHMREQGHGCIVALADVAALRPWRQYLAYNVAKAGVVALVRTLARELAPEVRVNAIAPGPVLFPPDFAPEQRHQEIERTLLKREGRPENVADAVLFLARNDYVTGVILPVDGGRLYGG